MFKVGEKRSPVWDTFYKIPLQEDEARHRKRARLLDDIGQEWIGDNTELIFPKEVWFLVREFYQLLLKRDYSDLGRCWYPNECSEQFKRNWNDHRKHTIFCRDDYKLWYYHYYKEKVHPKDSRCNLFELKPLCEKQHPTKEVMRHINYGRVLYILNKL